MKVQHSGETVTLQLEDKEVHLLRRALERASFIDTPPNEQADILAFCARALEQLPAPIRL